jgi:hypothetical protein
VRSKIKLMALAAVAVMALGGQVAVADAATASHKTSKHAKKHKTVSRQTNSAGSTDVSDPGSTDVTGEGNGRGCHGGRGHHGRGGGRGNANETPLTGDTKTQAEAAAQAAYPDATIVRSETQDPDDPAGGVYEVHMTNSDGSEITVLLDKDFKVIGTESHDRGPRGGGDQDDAN